MATRENLNVAEMVAHTLERHLHREVTNEIVRKMVDNFRDQIEPIVKAEVEKVTLENVNYIKELMDMSEKLNINLKWEE